jgi:deoxyribonuclease V
MIACLDVYYSDSRAHAAAVVFESWSSTEVVAEYDATVAELAPYQPGQFYLRELQPLLAVIEKIKQSIDTYIIDGYCYLSADLAPGLGARLHDRLGRTSTMIGVAKNRYQQTSHATELFRGGSARPLFITAIGIDSEHAAHLIGSMAGQHRIPILIKAADGLSRSIRQRDSVSGSAVTGSASCATETESTRIEDELRRAD